MNAVGSSHHQCALVCLGAGLQHGEQSLELALQQGGRVAQLERRGSIPDIGGSQSQVHPAACLAHVVIDGA